MEEVYLHRMEEYLRNCVEEGEIAGANFLLYRQGVEEAYFETNIRGAENVTAFAEKYGIRKILFTSSIAPYGASEDLKTEETLPTPNTPYGISKLVA